MTDKPIRIRSMTDGDLDFAASLVAAEGWAGETRDALLELLRFSPAGGRVADWKGEPVGICMTTLYQRTGFIGELVVSLAMRGRGIGARLFADALTLSDHEGVTTVGLDGDLAAVPLYEKAGFRRVCRSLRFVGSPQRRRHPRVRCMSPDLAAQVREWDGHLFGDDRWELLARRGRGYPNLSLVLEGSAGLRAYGFARPGKGVLSIGPLAAVDPESAGILLEAFSLEAGTMPLRLGILETSTSLVAWLRSLPGFSEGEFSWRMERGGPQGPGRSPMFAAIGSAAAG